MNVEDALKYPDETALLRRRGYILTASGGGMCAWVNDDIKISITCEKGGATDKWIARNDGGQTVGSGPTCDILLKRLLPLERGPLATDGAIRDVYEVAQRILKNKRALGPLSTGERLAAALIFDKRSWMSDYSILGAIDRLGNDWFLATMTVRNHLVNEGKIPGAPKRR